MANEKVCIILPVYNVRDYLERCMDSILLQSFHHYDVKLIDDGSTDGSAALCDEIASRHENVFCYHKPNGGAGDARNYGIAKSIGCGYDYVAFVDPDDMLEPDYLEKLVRIGDADIAICGYKTILFQNDQIVSEKGFQNALPGTFVDYSEELCMLHKNTLLFMPWNKLFRMSLISQYGIRFGTTKRYEDMTFVYRYLMHCNSLAFTQDCLYRYSKYIRGRKSAVFSFANEYCEGAFISYDEGQKLATHMNALGMKTDAVEYFRKRLKQHLQTSLIGEMVVNLSMSELKWKERKRYIGELIEKYHVYFPEFDVEELEIIGNIVGTFANKENLNGIVLMSYLYKWKHNH